MGQGRSLARVGVVEVSQQAAQEVPHRSSSPPPDDLTHLYTAALLKLTVELRRPEPRALEETLERILAGTPIDGQAFRGYLLRYFSLLRRD